MYWWTIAWFGPTVREIGLSQSTPTPKIQEFVLVVVSVTVGAPLLALAIAVAPMAPDPFVPEVSTPVMLTTVSEDAADSDNVAVTDTLLSTVGANARQISAVPRCAFARATNCQVSPAPLMPVTVLFVPLAGASADTNASSSSFGAVVENVLVVTDVLALALWPQATVSIGVVDGAGGCAWAIVACT